MLSKSEAYSAEFGQDFSATLAQLERHPDKFMAVLAADFLAGPHPDREEAEISLRAIWLMFRMNDAALTGNERVLGRYINSIMEQHANWRAADAAEIGLEDHLRLNGAI